MPKSAGTREDLPLIHRHPNALWLNGHRMGYGRYEPPLKYSCAGQRFAHKGQWFRRLSGCRAIGGDAVRLADRAGQMTRLAKARIVKPFPLFQSRIFFHNCREIAKGKRQKDEDFPL